MKLGCSSLLDEDLFRDNKDAFLQLSMALVYAALAQEGWNRDVNVDDHFRGAGKLAMSNAAIDFRHITLSTVR